MTTAYTVKLSPSSKGNNINQNWGSTGNPYSNGAYTFKTNDTLAVTATENLTITVNGPPNGNNPFPNTLPNDQAASTTPWNSGLMTATSGCQITVTVGSVSIDPEVIVTDG